MHAELQALLVLQERDQRVAYLEAELERIPADLAAHERALTVHQERFDKIKTTTRQIEADRKKLELEVDSKKALIAKYREQQLQTRKNEEFAALHHEIERAEKEIVILEDRELDLMSAYELGQKDTAREQEALKATQAKQAQAKAELAKKKAVVETDLATAREQQGAAEKTVEEATLTRYRRILKSKKDAAIVPIMHGNCGGCHMKLTSQTVVAARGDALAACENCGRLLYWQG